PAWLGPLSADGSGSDTTGGDELPAGCGDALPVNGEMITVAHADADELDDIVASAPEGATLVLEDGVYDRAGRPPLHLGTAGITLRGSGLGANVVLDGGFASDLLIEIGADDVTLADLELRNSTSELVDIRPIDTTIRRPRLVRL